MPRRGEGCEKHLYAQWGLQACRTWPKLFSRQTGVSTTRFWGLSAYFQIFNCSSVGSRGKNRDFEGNASPLRRALASRRASSLSHRSSISLSSCRFVIEVVLLI
jgi:hypothetical protein